MANLTEMMTTLFTAPVEASLKAEAEYRETWVKWIERTSSLVTATGLASEAQAEFIEKQLNLAPVMKFDAAIDIGVTMRVTAVRGKEGSATLGLSVGPFSASGSFSFMEQNTQESVLNARARYQLSNTNTQSLVGYLKDANIKYTNKTQLDAAKAKVSPPQTGGGDE